MKNIASAFLDKVPNEVADEILVEQASTAMAEKLAKVRTEKGRGGWHTKTCSTDDLMAKLLTKVEEGDMVDVMNYAAMIYVRNELYGSE